MNIDLSNIILLIKSDLTFPIFYKGRKSVVTNFLHLLHSTAHCSDKITHSYSY